MLEISLTLLLTHFWFLLVVPENSWGLHLFLSLWWLLQLKLGRVICKMFRIWIDLPSLISSFLYFRFDCLDYCPCTVQRRRIWRNCKKTKWSFICKSFYISCFMNWSIVNNEANLTFTSFARLISSLNKIVKKMN